MEILTLRYKDAVKSVSTLEEILKEPYSVIVRDATIQRFEYTFEAFWKFLKEYLKEKEGIISNSPKSCFRELLAIRIIDEDETIKCFEMTDTRNETSHTYKEEFAKAIYDKIPQYSALIKKILDKTK